MLIYSQAPSSTISRKLIEGFKLDKTRIIVALTANADGSHKLPLFSLGKQSRPNVLRRKLVHRWASNMLTMPKLGWLVTHFSTSSTRSTLKWLLKCRKHFYFLTTPTHKAINMSNVEIIFLPPNKTAEVQPPTDVFSTGPPMSMWTLSKEVVLISVGPLSTRVLPFNASLALNVGFFQSKQFISFCFFQNDQIFHWSIWMPPLHSLHTRHYECDLPIPHFLLWWLGIYSKHLCLI